MTQTPESVSTPQAAARDSRPAIEIVQPQRYSQGCLTTGLEFAAKTSNPPKP